MRAIREEKAVVRLKQMEPLGDRVTNPGVQVAAGI